MGVRVSPRPSQPLSGLILGSKHQSNLTTGLDVGCLSKSNR